MQYHLYVQYHYSLYISATDMVRRDAGDIMNEIKNWSVHGYDIFS